MISLYKIDLTEDEKEELARSLRDLYQELQDKINVLEDSGGLGYAAPLKESRDRVDEVARLLSDPFFLEEKEAEYRLEQTANHYDTMIRIGALEVDEN